MPDHRVKRLLERIQRAVARSTSTGDARHWLILTRQLGEGPSLLWDRIHLSRVLQNNLRLAAIESHPSRHSRSLPFPLLGIREVACDRQEDHGRKGLIWVSRAEVEEDGGRTIAMTMCTGPDFLDKWAA